MSSFRVSFHTLGCKLNQLETESIAAAFAAEGFVIAPWGKAADIYIVNTCTVTSMAEQKARREIRKVLRDRPSACVVATGCYAQLDPEAIAAVADEINGAFAESGSAAPFGRRRIAVVSGDLKAALLDLPAYIRDSACSSAELPEILASWIDERRDGEADPFRFDPSDFAFHSRASLKIQDGCDNSCAYCRVRIARGRSVSLAVPEILARLRSLEEKGYAEAVLTGINVSRYRDESGIDFPALLDLLIAGTERIALRISSTEPDCVDERFARSVASPRVRPHFHLSVQSGSDAVLKRMRRRYGRDKVLRAAEMLRAAKDDPFIACDIIAGFPGESDTDFEKTVELCDEIGFAWIHAFSYSPRPGTEAASFKDRVPERIAGNRVERLTNSAREGREKYIERWKGRTVSAIVEAGKSGARDGDFPALSENYLKLSVRGEVSGPIPAPGSSILCRIGGMSNIHEEEVSAEFLEILV